MGQVFIEAGKCNFKDLRDFSIFEYIPQFRGRNIDLTNPDLEWGKQRELVEING